MADDKKRDDYNMEMSDRVNSPRVNAPRAPQPHYVVADNPAFPIVSYCLSSILMTVTNKFVLSGVDFNLNFFLLCVQVG